MWTQNPLGPLRTCSVTTSGQCVRNATCFSQSSSPFQIIKSRSCEEPISLVDAASSHALKDHCLKCSKRCRSIIQQTSDPKVVAWFQGLRKSNVAEYRRIMNDHAAQIPQTGRGVRAKFDLLEYLDHIQYAFTCIVCCCCGLIQVIEGIILGNCRLKIKVLHL